MKKTFALLAVLMLLATMLPGTAMAYAPLEIPATTFNHTLTLTEAHLKKLPDETVITYKYAVGAAQMMLGTKAADGKVTYEYVDAKGVTGAPVITGNVDTGVVFDTNSVFVNGVSTVAVQVNWDNVVITDPGVYLWKVTKGIDTAMTKGTSNNHSDDDKEFYLFAIALNNSENNGLAIKSVGISMANTLDPKEGGVDDSYPVKKVSLEIKKQITGNMTSANQYFPFKIVLNTLPGKYTISGIQASVPATAYNAAEVNATSIEVNDTGKGEATIWLKHGDIAKVEGLPYGSSYTIVELPEVAAGFEVSATVTGDAVNTDSVKDDYTVTDDSLTVDTTVTYLNKKNAEVPTGVVLETSAPLAGILLAMSLLTFLFISKRKAAVL